MPINEATVESLSVQTKSVTNKTSGLNRELEFRDIFFLSLGGRPLFPLSLNMESLRRL